MAVLWGVAMGVSETIMRASLADIVDRGELAISYGTFGMLCGVLWSIGGHIIAFLLQISALTQSLSLLALAALNGHLGSRGKRL